MGHLRAEERRRDECGVVDHHGRALGLRAHLDALDGARAEVVGVGLLVVYADVHLGAFDCSCLIGRALFDQQRVLIKSDIIRGGTGRGRGLKVHPLYIKDPTRRHR